MSMLRTCVCTAFHPTSRVFCHLEPRVVPMHFLKGHAHVFRISGLWHLWSPTCQCCVLVDVPVNILSSSLSLICKKGSLKKDPFRSQTCSADQSSSVVGSCVSMCVVCVRLLTWSVNRTNNESADCISPDVESMVCFAHVTDSLRVLRGTRGKTPSLGSAE